MGPFFRAQWIYCKKNKGSIWERARPDQQQFRVGPKGTSVPRASFDGTLDGAFQLMDGVDGEVLPEVQLGTMALEHGFFGSPHPRFKSHEFTAFIRGHDARRNPRDSEVLGVHQVQASRCVILPNPNYCPCDALF